MNSFTEKPDQLITSLQSTPGDKTIFAQIKPWDLKHALSKCRSLGVTVNDMWLAAHTNAFYELHKSRGIDIGP